MSRLSFSPLDRSALAARGISERDAQRQAQWLLQGTRFMNLARPAVVGDGIIRLTDEEADRSAADYATRLDQIRVTKFVPASGAASRMFSCLLGFLNNRFEIDSRRLAAETPPASEAGAFLYEFFSGLKRGGFAFDRELDSAMQRTGGSLFQALQNHEYRRILTTLLCPEHLGYSRLPKALIPFHRSRGRAHTPLEEHLLEALAYGRGRDAVCRVHFTVSPEHRDAIESLVQGAIKRLGSQLEAFDVRYSVQDPATDTIAITPEGMLFHDESGELLLRPGGHGALIRNLDSLDSDLAFIKNIDNVVPPSRTAGSVYWKKVLGGFLLRQQDRVFRRLRALADHAPDAMAAAERYAREELGLSIPADLNDAGRFLWLSKLLNRPIRVCGMVENRGETGGGPFWVRDDRGVLSLQIVESAQINQDDAGQVAVVKASTHFNPVDLVCGLRDFAGRRFPLGNYVNPDTYFVTAKTRGGRPLKALEWPGLWNGAMHDWLTFFVEIPVSTFTPVKTVNDLLRAEHQNFSRE